MKTPYDGEFKDWLSKTHGNEKPNEVWSDEKKVAYVEWFKARVAHAKHLQRMHKQQVEADARKRVTATLTPKPRPKRNKKGKKVGAK